jgi:hypothetical protein
MSKKSWNRGSRASDVESTNLRRRLLRLRYCTIGRAGFRNSCVEIFTSLYYYTGNELFWQIYTEYVNNEMILKIFMTKPNSVDIHEYTHITLILEYSTWSTPSSNEDVVRRHGRWIVVPVKQVYWTKRTVQV